MRELPQFVNQQEKTTKAWYANSSKEQLEAATHRQQKPAADLYSRDYARQSPSTFVDAYYTAQTWCQIYAEGVMPPSDQCEWNVPSDVSLRIIGTPTNPKQAERPRSKRVFSGYHKIQGRMCSRCHKQAHYQNTCTTFLGTHPLEEVSSNQPSGSIPRKPKKCGICGVPGHTRLTCQDPHRL
ncbi:hypothetical protein OROGR_022054 [Orobanche gracilis]